MTTVKSRKPTGDTYAVIRLGPLWEVRRTTYRDGFRFEEQRIEAFANESDAEKLARALMEQGDQS